MYPLLNDDTCYFLAVDFDKADWREDAKAFVNSCRELNVPVALEISRSGNGAHVWIFFASAVAARDTRRLGTALISHTCNRTRQLKLGSYDRLFPNQDTVPKGDFGNLIALPLQKQPRERNCSVFVAENFPRHIGLPRGCTEPAIDLLKEHGIRCDIKDERFSGQPIDIQFEGTLRDDQERAAKAMLKFDTGILCAPTAFGKTVTGAALIARRGVNTLILVHRTEMLKQQRNTVIDELDELSAATPRVLLATGKLVGAGFDHPPLDTLVLAMLISWTR